MENLRVNKIEDLKPGQVIIDMYGCYLITEIEEGHITGWDLQRQHYDKICGCVNCISDFSIVSPDDVKRLKLEWL